MAQDQSWYDYISQAAGDWASSTANVLTDWGSSLSTKFGQLIGANPSVRVAQAVAAPVSDWLGSKTTGVTNSRDIFQVATGNAAPGITLSSTIFDGLFDVPRDMPDTSSGPKATGNNITQAAQAGSASMPFWIKGTIALAAVVGVAMLVKGVIEK